MPDRPTIFPNKQIQSVLPAIRERIHELAGKVKALVMPEMNLGQMYFEMERCAKGQCPTVLLPHAGGTVHNPEDIYKAIMKAVR